MGLKILATGKLCAKAELVKFCRYIIFCIFRLFRISWIIKALTEVLYFEFMKIPNRSADDKKKNMIENNKSKQKINMMVMFVVFENKVIKRIINNEHDGTKDIINDVSVIFIK